MHVQRLSAPLGATVSDLDIRSIDDALFTELNRLFCQHHVLVFPQQALTPEDQIRFAQRWGSLVRHPYAALKGYPNIIELTNQGKARDVNQHWHSDMTYNECPPKLTMLYALQAPEIGGETAFANQCLAYDELSDGLKSVVTGLAAHHCAKGLAKLYGQNEAEAPRALHPVVRQHDESGQRSLYVCKAFTQRFDGWSREESASLLEYLFKHTTRPEFQGRHQWHVGDLVMWDNRSVLHYAVHDHGDDSRVIHRLQVEGSKPC